MRRPARFVVSSCLAVSAFATLPGAADAAGCAGADVMPSAASGASANHATLCLLNQQRRSHGLRPLRSDRKAQLEGAAPPDTRCRRG